MLSRVTPLRLLRLCLKELRESLRDRRTIVTLILMPLLVYPLLSLVLNRVLLTSANTKSEEFVTVGISSSLNESLVTDLLHIGFTLVQDPQAASLLVEPTVEDGKPRSSQEPLPYALPRPQVMPLGDDGKEALRNQAVDIVITRRVSMPNPREDEQDANLRVAQSPQAEAAAAMAQRYQNIKSLSAQYDPEQVRSLVGHLEIRYRKSDWRSERALQVVERILATLNNETAHTILGRRYDAPFRVLATPVMMKSSYADVLSTMVPLVLVLMTMAGAVYPAIDLTAGERERGTMEALMISPMPSYVLLLAKYSAVVTVALLTALANLLAMTVTLWVSGIGTLVFGDSTLSASTVGTVLLLLVLFTMFFAALLLAVTSFARSFKEAQAYLIPLMLLALTPGVMSLLPGIKFTPLLATVPLVNIVLLAREVLVNNAEWNVALVAVICNTVYALAALALASRLFGSDASMQGSRGSWRDLFARPKKRAEFPTVDQMAMTMAVMFPLYFIASSSLPKLGGGLAYRLGWSAVVSFALILILPIFVTSYQRIRLRSTFRLAWPTTKQWAVWVPALLLLASSAWMFAHEIIIIGKQLDIATISTSQMEQVAKFNEELKNLPLAFVLFVFAITPAVCEEFLFRGFVLSSLHRLSPRTAVFLSAFLFGLMHVLTSQVLAVERFAPTMFMGLILGFVAVRCRSIWPGIILHAVHNGLLLSMAHFSDQLRERKILIEETEHLPFNWLAAGTVLVLIGFAWLWSATRKAREAGAEDPSEESPQSPNLEPASLPGADAMPLSEGADG